MAQSEQTGIIGKGITIRGNLTGGGDLVIEGKVEGQISLKNHLTIERTGHVEAEIRAEELTINGEASGNIDASSMVSISSSAKVAGDIKAPRVVIEDGAVFNGTIQMDVKLPDDNYRGNDALMANTVIGSSIVIDGEISGDEDLVVQGTVKGKISLKESLYVESSGVVEADIETQNVEVSGKVTGNINASDKVELKTDCRVIGDIKAPRILIADGASFKGNVDMDMKER